MSAQFTCPVCGFVGLSEPHVDATGSPTYSMCPCCGTFFGGDDVEHTHEELRHTWVEEGAKWWSQHQLSPEGWNAEAQLKAAGLAVTHGRN